MTMKINNELQWYGQYMQSIKSRMLQSAKLEAYPNVDSPASSSVLVGGKQRMMSDLESGVMTG
jgi:hypothetical protein